MHQTSYDPHQRNGVELTGQASATLSISNITNADAGDYSVLVYNIAGNTTSHVTLVAVNYAPVVVSLEGPTHVLYPGNMIVASVDATGTSPLAYQWKVRE